MKIIQTVGLDVREADERKMEMEAEFGCVAFGSLKGVPVVGSERRKFRGKREGTGMSKSKNRS